MICLFPDRCDEMAQRKVEPINETCHSCLIFNWPRFLCTILLCQKSFLKVSSKWLLTLSQTSPGFYVSAVQVF